MTIVRYIPRDIIEIKDQVTKSNTAEIFTFDKKVIRVRSDLLIILL